MFEYSIRHKNQECHNNNKQKKTTLTPSVYNNHNNRDVCIIPRTTRLPSPMPLISFYDQYAHARTLSHGEGDDTCMRPIYDRPYTCMYFAGFVCVCVCVQIIPSCRRHNEARARAAFLRFRVIDADPLPRFGRSSVPFMPLLYVIHSTWTAAAAAKFV